MAFTYFNERLQYTVAKMMKELKDTCDGKNLSVGQVTKDKDGNYSDKLFREFLHDLVTADYPQSRTAGFTKERQAEYEHETDYLETLLYVVIRSTQANIGYFPFKANGKPVDQDTFTNILSLFNSTQGWPVRLSFSPGGMKDVTVKHLLSSRMEATARSVYYYITGEDMSFPDPYFMVSNAPEVTSEETVSGSSAGSKDTAGLDYQMAVKDYEDSLYYGDDRSRKAKEEDDQRTEELFDEQCGTRYSLDPAARPEDRELLDKQQRRLQIFFRCKDEFVERFKHLIEITKSGDQKYTFALSRKTEIWLRNNDLTAYSDEELSDKVFDHLFAASKEVLLWQGKKV